MSELREWYERKTQALIEKYGGFGPRLHYHIGPVRLSYSDLRHEMWRAQEEELKIAFDAWAPWVKTGARALDVGCGLGGSMLWLLDRGVAHVTGLTIAESHAPLLRERAEDAGVAERVNVAVGDAHGWRCDDRFDFVYSVQAALLFDRSRWWPHVAAMLKPGGALLIDEFLVCDKTLKPAFDAAYAANIGTRDEYVREAGAFGFKLAHEVDITETTADYWELCARYAETEKTAGVHQTPSFHRAMAEAQRARRYEHRLLAFVVTSPL